MNKQAVAGLIKKKYDYRKTFDDLSVSQKKTLFFISGLADVDANFIAPSQDIATLMKRGLVHKNANGRLAINNSIQRIIENHLEELELCRNRR